MFDRQKIRDAVFRAFQSQLGESRFKGAQQIPDIIASKVADSLEQITEDETVPDVEQVQVVEKVK